MQNFRENKSFGKMQNFRENQNFRRKIEILGKTSKFQTKTGNFRRKIDILDERSVAVIDTF